MGATTSTVNDEEIFHEARRVYPAARRRGIEQFTVDGCQADSELRLLVTGLDKMSRDNKWKCVVTASSRSELLLVLRSTTPCVRQRGNV